MRIYVTIPSPDRQCHVLKALYNVHELYRPHCIASECTKISGFRVEGWCGVREAPVITPPPQCEILSKFGTL